MGKAHTKGRKFEQDTGKFLLKYNGECPEFAGMTTDTGRVGQQTNLKIDVISKSYAGECKVGDHVPKTPFEWFKKITKRAKDNNKNPLLAIKKDGRKYDNNILHCITPERHAELLRKESEYDKTKT